MSHNPYSPPSSAVADAPEAGEIQRPRAVVVAVGLFTAEVVLGIALFCFVLLSDPQVRGEPLAIAIGGVFLLVVCGVSGLLIWKIWQGRNWARIFWLVCSVLALLGRFMPEEEVAAFDTTWLDAIGTLLDLGALFLVFGPGRAWFARRN